MSGVDVCISVCVPTALRLAEPHVALVLYSICQVVLRIGSYLYNIKTPRPTSVLEGKSKYLGTYFVILKFVLLGFKVEDMNTVYITGLSPPTCQSQVIDTDHEVIPMS